MNANPIHNIAMPPETDSNVLLPNGDVLAAFENFRKKGHPAKIVGEGLPWRPPALNQKLKEKDKHLQGVAITANHAVLTSNEHIIVGNPIPENSQTYKCDFVCRLRHHTFDHLGGIQTIGNWLVVGFEDSDNYPDASSEIRFYSFGENGQPHPQNHLTIQRNRYAGGDDPAPSAGKAGSVGITNYRDGNNFRYLLAVCPWQGIEYQGHRNGEIHFYRTQPGFSLSNPDCSFGDNPFCIWRASEHMQRDNWNPDNKWEGYVHAISLLADIGGNLYLVGFHRNVNKDFADLYQLNLNNGNPTLTKFARFHATCRHGTSFRYGGSAFVTQEGNIRLFACERGIQQDRNEMRYIRMNVFHC